MAVQSPESASELDGALADVAAELADVGTDDNAATLSDEEFLDFSNPDDVLGERVLSPDVDLDDAEAAAKFAADRSAPKPMVPTPQSAPAPATEPAIIQVDALASPPPETSPREQAAHGFAPADFAPVAPAAREEDLSDFADPESVLAEVSRELEATQRHAEARALDEPTTDEVVAKPAPSIDTATSAVAVEAQAVARAAEPAPEMPPPAGAIDQLDEVLADKAEKVLAEAGPTPRIMEAAAEPALEAAAAPTAPAQPVPPVAHAAPEAAAKRPTDQATPVEKPATPAASVEQKPAAAPEPRAPRKPVLRPAIDAVAARALRPLVRINAKLSHTSRHTIAWLAMVTLFNATAVWGYVLVRGPTRPLVAAGEGIRFLKPGETAPATHGHDGHGDAHAAADHGDGHGDAHATKKPDKKDAGQGGHGAADKKKDASHGKPAKKDDGHGAPAKKKDDGHGASAKKKDDGHGASAKKKDDGHGAPKKEAKGAKKPDKKQAAGHH